MSKPNTDLTGLKPSNLFEHLCREVLFCIWWVRVAIKALTGRWHIFREYPSWFVVRFVGYDAGNSDPEMVNLAQQARAELELRVDRMAREIEGMAAQKDEACKD